MLNDAARVWSGTLVLGASLLLVSAAPGKDGAEAEAKTPIARQSAAMISLPSLPTLTKGVEIVRAAITGPEVATPTVQSEAVLPVPRPRDQAALTDPSAEPSNALLSTSEDALALIKSYEPLITEAHRTHHGIWVVGYNHRATARAGITVTAEEADALLRSDIRALERLVKQVVLVPLTQNEFSALVALAFDVGEMNFVNSSVLARVNDQNRRAAADAFMRWNRVNANGLSVESQQATKRRQQERTLFLAS